MGKFLFALILIVICIIAYFKIGIPPKEENHDGEFVQSYVKEITI